MTTKKRLQKQAKSMGQYEFKTVDLDSDISQVQERLAVLDKKADIELDSVKSESGKDLHESQNKHISCLIFLMRYVLSLVLSHFLKRVPSHQMLDYHCLL